MYSVCVIIYANKDDDDYYYSRYNFCGLSLSLLRPRPYPVTPKYNEPAFIPFLSITFQGEVYVDQNILSVNNYRINIGDSSFTVVAMILLNTLPF